MGLEWVNQSLMYVCIPSERNPCAVLTSNPPPCRYMATEMMHLVNNAVGRRESRAENQIWGRYLASMAPAPRKITLSLLRGRYVFHAT